MTPMARLHGVTFFGWMLILGSIYQILILYFAGYDHYSYLHQEYLPKVIFMRYTFSWVIKIAGFILGVGILKLNEPCRKLAIMNSLVIVLTVHLKHTYFAYSLHTKYLDHVFGDIYPGVTFSSLTWPSLIIQRSIDVIFGLLFIYYFTRPRVRRQFQSNKKS